MDHLTLQDRVRGLVEPTVERLGFELVAVEWLGRVLRLSIDGPQGVTADDCGVVSEHVSPLLDASDPVPGRYHLEVSSPGIDRPVQRLVDFARFKGRRVKLKLADRAKLAGRLDGVDGGDVLVLPDRAEPTRIPREAIVAAHLVLTLEEYVLLREVRDDQ